MRDGGKKRKKRRWKVRGIVNKERKRWKGVKDIKMEEGEEYFRELLGGVEECYGVKEGGQEKRRGS